MTPLRDSEYDLTHIIVRPLYFGLFSNVLVPMGLLMVIYYLNNRGWHPLVGDETANLLFYVFAAVALVHVGLVIAWRRKLYATPMITRQERFELDFTSEYLRRTRPLFIVIAAVSLYGFIYFFITGRFNESLLFVIFSFLVFQLVRPRYGLVQKLIDKQQALVDKGQFRPHDQSDRLQA